MIGLNKFFIFNQKGQSLLEALLAVFIVLIGLSGIITLAWWNLMGGQESESRIIAANLAREGIEVVRSIRDSNWLLCEEWEDKQCVSWDVGLEDTLNKDYSAIAVFELASNEWSLDFFPNLIEDDATRMYRYEANGYYLQDTELLSGDPTNYYRILLLDEICDDDSVVESGSACEDTVDVKKIGIRVQSIINWDEHGRSHSITVEDWIYNWH